VNMGLLDSQKGGRQAGEADRLSITIDGPRGREESVVAI